MNKADLVNAVSQQTALSKDEAVNIVELVIDIIKTTLADGKTLKIAGFGTFQVHKKSRKKGQEFQN